MSLSFVISKFDPLKYLLSKTTLTGRLAKWEMILSEFDIDYIDRKAIKEQSIANQLENAPMESSNPILENFLDTHILQKELVTWKFYFDSSYAYHDSSADILFITPLGVKIPKSYKLLFPCTNNMVEY